MSATLRKNSAGLRLGITAAELVGLHDKPPTAQRAGAAQGVVTLGAGAALLTTAATTSTPYGFSQAQADGLIARVNSLLTDNIALAALVNELRAALVAKGLIKGAA